MMSRFVIEQLESRTLLSATLVRLETTFGNIDVRLTDDVTPITVTNFLNYVNSGRYNNTFFYRDSGAVIQGGGFTYPGFNRVPQDAAIVNEFQAGVTTNIRGTIGMAKTSDPNSATSDFFINLTDNSSSFDNPLNSGGFTTFGTVTSDTLATVDTIAAVPVAHVFQPPFDEIPLQNYSGSGDPTANNLIFVFRAEVLGQYTNTVTFGDNGVKAVTFTDGDGTLTTLSLKGGLGTINFGSEVFETTSKGRATITGTNLFLNDLSIANAAGSKFSIKAVGGNGSVDLHDFTATGSVSSVSAATTNLTGTFTMNGDIAKITFGSITGGDIVLNGAGLQPKISVIGAISDGSITATGAIASLTAGSWTDSNGSSSQLTAAAVNKLTIRGEMAADMTLSGSGVVLGKANVANVTGGNWFINDSAGSIKTAVTSSTWTAVLGGSVSKFSGVSLSGNFTARSAGSIKAVSINNANFTLNKTFDGAAALGKLSASSITNTNVRSTDLIGSVKANAIDGSFFSAGINFGDNSIDDVTDFVNNATIAKFKTGTFNNSGVIAQTMGKIALGLTNDAAPTVDFYGVAADKIASLSAVVIDKKLSLKGLDDPAAVPGLIAAQGVTLANLQVQVV